MAKKAKKDFPEIDFSKSIMVGDSASDMQFGKNAGMITVFVGDQTKLKDDNKVQVDEYYDSLSEFANSLIR